MGSDKPQAVVLGLGVSIVLGGCAALWISAFGSAAWILGVWAVVAVLVSVSLASFFARSDKDDGRAAEGWICIGLATIGAVIWLGITPSEVGVTPEFTVGDRNGGSARLASLTAWDEQGRGIRMHAPLDGRDEAGPPSRVEADISQGLGVPREWSFRFTQPTWAVFDQEGRQRTGPDGVTVRVLAIARGGDVTEIYREHIDPFSRESDRSWRSAKTQVPHEAVELAVEVLPGPPGSNTWNDHLFFEPGALSRSGLVGQIRAKTGLLGGWGGRFSVLLIALGGVHLLCLAVGPKWLCYCELATPPERGRGRIALKPIFIVSAALLLVGAGVALWTAPHASSWTTPVVVEADGGADASLSLGWSADRAESVPLVAHEGASSVTEFVCVLPARRHYDAVLTVRAGDEPVTVRSVVFIDVRDPRDHSRSMSLEETRVPPGRTIELDLGRIGQPPVSRAAWFGWVTALFAVSAGSFLAMCFGSLRAPASAAWPCSRWSPSGMALVLGVWVFAAGLHLLATLVQPIAVSADSRMYLLQAIGLLRNGDAHIGGTIYTLNRMPGYAATIAPLLRAGAMSLTVVAVFQAVVYAGAVLMLFWACRRWLVPWVAAVLVAAALVTPPVLWASVQILTESLFSSLVLVAVASLLLHTQTDGRRSLLWLGLFALAAACTVLVRPNGILLVPLCVAAGVPVVMHRFWSGSGLGSSLRAALLASVPYVLACVVPVAAAGAWSARNQERFGFQGSTDMRAITDVVGLMASGVFDPRSLDDDSYRLYAQGQRRLWYGYHIWHLRDDYTMFQSGRGRTLDNAWISEIDAWAQRIASESEQRSPVAFRAVAIVRTAYWTLLTPESGYDGIRRSGRQPWFPKGADDRWIDNVRQRAEAINPHLVYDRRVPPGWLDNRLAPWSDLVHHPVHNLLFVVASVFGVALVATGRVWLALPWLFYLGCIVVNIYLSNFRPRYTHPMEALLLFQVGIGISALGALFSNRHNASRNAPAQDAQQDPPENPDGEETRPFEGVR